MDDKYSSLKTLIRDQHYSKARLLIRQNAPYLSKELLEHKNALLHALLCQYTSKTPPYTFDDNQDLTNLVQDFLETGANPNYIPEQCKTCSDSPLKAPRPLVSIAVSQGFLRIIDLLNQYQVDWGFKDSQDNNLLHLLCLDRVEYRQLELVFKLAKTQGIDVVQWMNQKNSKGDIPFHIWLGNRNTLLGMQLKFSQEEQLIELFLAQGVNLHARTADGKTALVLLVLLVLNAHVLALGHLDLEYVKDTIKTFIEKGSDIHTEDTESLHMLSRFPLSRPFLAELLKDFIKIQYDEHLNKIRAQEGFDKAWGEDPVRLFAACAGTPLEMIIRRPCLKTLYQESVSSTSWMISPKEVLHTLLHQLPNLFGARKDIGLSKLSVDQPTSDVDPKSMKRRLEELPLELQDIIYSYVVPNLLKDYGIVWVDEAALHRAFNKLVIFYRQKVESNNLISWFPKIFK